MQLIIIVTVIQGADQGRSGKAAEEHGQGVRQVLCYVMLCYDMI